MQAMAGRGEAGTDADVSRGPTTLWLGGGGTTGSGDTPDVVGWMGEGRESSRCLATPSERQGVFETCWDNC